ncbi:MAG: rhomboid family intramembrane serine protease [Candidatus Heimdallarchaeota archaeon]|nr:MAG: rhomboid family intramembrane serine protease [Candidatus Heimdallarchaeota archaeon]
MTPKNRMPDSYSENIPPIPGTIFLVISLILIYIAGMVLFPYDLLRQSPEVLQLLGENDKVLQGEIYRLFSAIFIHANVVHLVSNILFLIIFGIRLEELKSSSFLIVGFIFCGFVGNVASLIWFLLAIRMTSVGSSGAIFGLLGIVYFLVRGNTKRERRQALYILIIFFLITIGQDTNFISHLFGLLGGIFFAWLYEYLYKIKSR